MHVHTSNTLCASTSYVVPMATSAQEPMMQFATLLLPLRKMIVSTWDENNYMCSLVEIWDFATMNLRLVATI
jgi:hypothetical protein